MKPGRDDSRSQISDAIGLSASEWNWAIRMLEGSGRVFQVGERRGIRVNCFAYIATLIGAVGKIV